MVESALNVLLKMTRDRGTELGREAYNWMLLSAASIVFCGSCLGIASTLLCYLAVQDARREDLAASTTRLLWGKRITLLGATLSLLAGAAALAVRHLA